MEIKLIEKKDFDKFLPIKKEFLNDYGISEKSKEFIQREFNNPKNIIFIAEKENKIIGYIIGEIIKDDYERYGYISEIFVKKEQRKKGISTKLKDKFLKLLTKKRIKKCRIEVNPDNPSQKAYEEWGFKIDKYGMGYDLSKSFGTSEQI